MQCLLCKQEQDRLVEAHIFPRGFFSTLPTKRQVRTIDSTGTMGRKLRNVIYDSHILCHHCEQDILAPLDDYAIRVIRDKEGAFRIDLPAEAQMGRWVFPEVDKRKIRAFIASVLWRSSVSQQLELKDVSIGEVYEERIRRDLQLCGKFDYVDMVLCYLTDPIHGAFFIPARTKFRPLDTSRDKQRVNGWILQFPNIHIAVSLDRRHHPLRMLSEFSPDLTGRPHSIRTSTSLHPDNSDYYLMVFEAARQKDLSARIMKSLEGVSLR